MGKEPAAEFLLQIRHLDRGLSWCQDTSFTGLIDILVVVFHLTLCASMSYFYLGIDVSKGYADFVIVDRYVVDPTFQLTDRAFASHTLQSEDVRLA